MKKLVYSEYFEIVVDLESNTIFKVYETDDHLLHEIQGSRRTVTPQFASGLCSGNTRNVLASLTESGSLIRVFLIDPISYSSPCYKKEKAREAFKKMWEETHQRDGFVTWGINHDEYPTGTKYNTSLYINREIYDNQVEGFLKADSQTI